MKDYIAKIILILLDIISISFAIILAFYFRNFIDIFETTHTISLQNYLSFYPIYVVTVAVLAYEGIYTYRYDFWHESRLVIKVLIFSSILVFAYLAMTKSIENYSRLVIGFSFIFMTLLIPLSKNISKKVLFLMGLW